MADIGTSCEIARDGADGCVVALDTRVYRLSAIKKAAYKFGDRSHIQVRTQENDRVEVILKAKGDKNEGAFLAGEFCNEVLDQDLREQIAEDTVAIRDLLLAHAFSNTSLINPELDTVDFRVDPLRIRLADSQKTGD